MKLCIYDPATGAIFQNVESNDLDGIALSIPDGMLAIEGEYDPAVYYIDGSGDPQLLPARPNVYCTWNGTAWVDSRNPAQIATDLNTARYATNTDKRQVFYRLAQQGAYPMAELVDDSTYFPATVEEYLSTLPTAEHDAVKAALKYEPLIWRLHPYLIGGPGVTGFIPWLAANKSVTITDAQLDTIFEVVAPPPYYSA